MIRKNIIRSRKGNIVLDGALFFIFMFVFVMVSYFGYKIYADMAPFVKEDITHNESIAAFEEVEDRYPAVFSGLIVLILIGFWAFVIVAGLMSQDHPVMFMFSILLCVFIIISAMILGNFYEDFFTDVEYSGLTAEFMIPHFIFTHTLEITLGILFTGLLIGFIRSK